MSSVPRANPKNLGKLTSSKIPQSDYKHFKVEEVYGNRIRRKWVGF